MPLPHPVLNAMGMSSAPTAPPCSRAVGDGLVPDRSTVVIPGGPNRVEQGLTVPHRAGEPQRVRRGRRRARRTGPIRERTGPLRPSVRGPNPLEEACRLGGRLA